MFWLYRMPRAVLLDRREWHDHESDQGLPEEDCGGVPRRAPANAAVDVLCQGGARRSALSHRPRRRPECLLPLKDIYLSSLNATRATRIVPMATPLFLCSIGQRAAPRPASWRRDAPRAQARPPPPHRLHPPSGNSSRALGVRSPPRRLHSTSIGRVPAHDVQSSSRRQAAVRALFVCAVPISSRRNSNWPRHADHFTNVDAHDAVEIGGFGFSFSFSDVHIGGAHGWVGWMRVLISKNLTVEGNA